MAMFGLNDLAKQIHDISVAHGWWEKDRGFPETIALCHSELSEALEEARKGHGETEVYYTENKPEGIPVELADCMIRILDWCGKQGVDIDRIVREKCEYNRKRPYKHGKVF